MKFISAIALVLATLPFMVFAANATDASDAAACRQVCCDAVVPGVRPAGNVGINCHFDSTGDCGFSGQVRACCVRLPLGATSGTGIGCQ